jgi:hypothetical protein
MMQPLQLINFSATTLLTGSLIHFGSLLLVVNPIPYMHSHQLTQQYLLATPMLVGNTNACWQPITYR